MVNSTGKIIVISILLAALTTCGGDKKENGQNGTGGENKFCSSDADCKELRCPGDVECAWKCTEGGEDKGVCVPVPKGIEESSAWLEGEDEREEQERDMCCYEKAAGELPEMPTDKLIIKGYVDVFGLDISTVGVTVDIFDPKDIYGITNFDEKSCDPPNALGSAVTTGKGGSSFVGEFTIELAPAKVPADRIVAVRTKGPNMVNAFKFDVYLGPIALSGDKKIGTIENFKSNAVSESTYAMVSISSGDPDGVTGSDDLGDCIGNGAVAGETQDCDGHQLMNATVGVTKTCQAFTYFDGDNESSHPQIDRTSTNTDGVYAAVDVAPGETYASGLAMVEGDLVELGSYRVVVFPDAVTIFSFKGPFPRPAECGE